MWGVGMTTVSPNMSDEAVVQILLGCRYTRLKVGDLCDGVVIVKVCRYLRERVNAGGRCTVAVTSGVRFPGLLKRMHRGAASFGFP